MPTHGTSDVEIGLPKGIIFTEIGLADCAILKLGRHTPTQNLAENPHRAKSKKQKERELFWAQNTQFPNDFLG